MREAPMGIEHAVRFTSLAIGIGLLCLPSGSAAAQSQEKQRPPNEAETILQDSKKQDPETPKEISECMKQWGPNTQMTKDEWAASCRRTLKYFPEKP
jgi:hypothetical protein